MLLTEVGPPSGPDPPAAATWGWPGKPWVQDAHWAPKGWGGASWGLRTWWPQAEERGALGRGEGPSRRCSKHALREAVQWPGTWRGDGQGQPRAWGGSERRTKGGGAGSWEPHCLPTGTAGLGAAGLGQQGWGLRGWGSGAGGCRAGAAGLGAAGLGPAGLRGWGQWGCRAGAAGLGPAGLQGWGQWGCGAGGCRAGAAGLGAAGLGLLGWGLQGWGCWDGGCRDGAAGLGRTTLRGREGSLMPPAPDQGLPLPGGPGHPQRLITWGWKQRWRLACS